MQLQSENDLKVANAIGWWKTQIIDIHPGSIDLRGYPVQELIGNVSFVSMIWLMLKGELPSEIQSRLLEAALVASVDHGPQAPSIAIARMSATCGVGVNNAMASGINALGDVHGGAGQQCMEVYDAVLAKAEDGAGEEVLREIVREELAQRVRLPGFGHRFHPVDPRAEPLLGMVEEAVAAGEVGGRYLKVARCIENLLAEIKKKPIPMNIDGATAVIFAELGFSPVEARGLFILSRSVGILAHAVEQTRQGGRIKGPMPTSIPYTYEGKARRTLKVTP